MGAQWEALRDPGDERVWRGSVFRFPARAPFEGTVDFMLVADAGSGSGFSLVCTTGYKAGHFEGALPKEALSEESAHAVSRRWLIDNWLEWIYPDTDVSRILLCSGYPEGVGGTRMSARA